MEILYRILEMLPVFILFGIIMYMELSEGNEMNNLSVLTALVNGGMTPAAACAMGGNMMAESSMRANNLQNSYEKKLGYNDDSYTAAVDAGTYTRERFINDKAGYGLCQWTSPDRKGNLHDFAKSHGKSIGDEIMQAEFCIAELKINYPALWAYLCETRDMAEAVFRICKEYERPAVNNTDARLKYAQQMYEEYGAELEKMHNAECIIQNAENGAEGSTCPMKPVHSGEHTPEAAYLLGHLNKLGYDVLWLGLDACLKDFQLKRGLTVDGMCGEETWEALLT